MFIDFTPVTNFLVFYGTKVKDYQYNCYLIAVINILITI